MDAGELLNRIASAVRVELADAFDRNFSLGGYFEAGGWEERRDGSPSHLVETGELRSSIRSETAGNNIIFSSDLPYAGIHNEGGEITVTEAMQGHFWKKYYEEGGRAGGERAEFYRNMALKPVGETIKMPERRFIGSGPDVEKIISEVASEVLEKEILNTIKRTIK